MPLDRFVCFQRTGERRGNPERFVRDTIEIQAVREFDRRRMLRFFPDGHRALAVIAGRIVHADLRRSRIFCRNDDHSRIRFDGV